jgi:hypothetical protein
VIAVLLGTSNNLTEMAFDANVTLRLSVTAEPNLPKITLSATNSALAARKPTLQPERPLTRFFRSTWSWERGRFRYGQMRKRRFRVVHNKWGQPWQNTRMLAALTLSPS